MATAGKSFVIQVSTATGGTYTTVADIQSASFSFAGENLDVTAFSTAPTAYRSRIQGLKDVTWEMSGFLKSTDTNGQAALRNSLVNDTDIFLRCLFQNTTADLAQQQVKVSAYDVTASVDGVVEVSISAEGTGTLTITT